MGDYGDSVGNRGVVVLPSNSSLILADSRFREDADVEEPADFLCRVSSAVAVKEILYRSLYWNQPVFAHNNTNHEVRFQLAQLPNTPPTADVFVCYASPFQCFRDLDGNPPGSSYQPPQGYSYAFQMETAFNWDCRLLNTNLTPLPHPYLTIPANTVYVSFRWTPSRGFTIQANLYDYNTNTMGAAIAIQLNDCSWIAKGHYVHGFGVFDPDQKKFVPQNSGTQQVIMANDVALLLPSRYVVVQSPELTKDRRTTSFHSQQLSGFANELAILPLLMENTCKFHTNVTTEDTTVVSLRQAYEPSVFRLTIRDEYGQVLVCDDPLGRLISTPGFLTPEDLLTLTDSSTSNVYRGRGRPNVVNMLTFGTSNLIWETGGNRNGRAWFSARMSPSVFNNYTFVSQRSECTNTPFDRGPLDPPYSNNAFAEVGLFSPYTPLNTTFYNFSIGIGLYGVPSDSPTQGPAQNAGVWYWNPQINPNPVMTPDLQYFISAVAGFPISNVTFYLLMLHPTENRIYGTWTSGTNRNHIPIVTVFPPLGVYANSDLQSFTPNPKYAISGFFQNTTRILFRVGLGVFWNNGNNNGDSITVTARGLFANSGIYWSSSVNSTRAQTEYRPPLSTINPNSQSSYSPAPYSFGNPNAQMLCEDVIHELTGLLEYN